MKFDTIIQADELNQILNHDNLVIVDVRFNLKNVEWGRTEHQTSHIPSAQYLHLDDDLSAEIKLGITGRHPWPSIQKIEDLLSKLGVMSDSQIIIYDQHHGGIAARMWAMCLFVGIEHVAVLNGGWEGWSSNNYPISSVTPDVIPSKFEATTGIFSITQVDKLDEYTCMIDARSSVRYQGLEEPIDPIAGHIPGAVSLPFLNNLDADKKWKSKEDIRSRFTDISCEDAVIYCGSGVTACHNLLAMKYAGLPLAHIYAGSWSHYITDTNRNVATGEE